MIFKRIVCPVDFSETSKKSLKKAVELAKQHGASLLVVHVLPKQPLLLPPMATMPTGLVQFQNELRESAKSSLQEMREESIPDDVASESLLESGDPGRTIAKIAEERAADLIVIASREDSALDRFIFGSVAEKVIRYASCPVLVLKDV